jgi:hypothetical protein
MSTAAEIVTDAFGLLGAIDIIDDGVSDAEMSKALRALNQMIDGWATEGLSTQDQTRTCTLDGTTSLLTSVTDELLASLSSNPADIANLLKLAPSLNVSGTGIPANTRILSIDDRRREIMLDTVTTIAGTTTVTFVALPFAAKFEQGVAALLAMRMAPLVGVDSIPPMTTRMAQAGWMALQANFMRIPPVIFDEALSQTSSRRANVISA